MTLTEPVDATFSVNGDEPQLSLSTAAARNLATTTKSVPQMQEITSRWLLRILPWVQTAAGTYRVNRRLSYLQGSGRVTFAQTGAEVRVIPPSLAELPVLHGLDDQPTLETIADHLVQREYETGEVIAEAGQPIEEGFLIAHGKVSLHGVGEYGDRTALGILTDGDYFGTQMLEEAPSTWDYTAQALTRCTMLTVPMRALREMLESSPPLRAHVDRLLAGGRLPRNVYGEAAIDLAAGHEGEPSLPGTFVDYDRTPREFELSIAQTILRVHTRVADLFNEPMNQIEQQLRLTVEALRERQEDELVNNRDFGLLHNATFDQHIPTRDGAPGPDDFDDLLAKVWKEPEYILAHPRAIAAFGHECNRMGVYPETVDYNGQQVPAWRGVPLLPCNKIPISKTNTTSILALRTGVAKQGVIGLHQTGLPDEYEPGMSVRFMGINDKAIISYLVSVYFSAAVLVPDALAILEDVEIGRTHA